MRSIRLICFAISAILLFSNANCKKKIKIEKIIDGAAFYVPATPQAMGPFDYTDNVKFDLEALIKPYGISLDNVTNIKPETINISIEDTTATKITFDIIDKITLELGTPNIAIRKVGSKDPVPHFLLLNIVPDVERDVDFLDFAKANDVTYHLTGVLNKPLDHPVNMKVAVQWHVTGTL